MEPVRTGFSTYIFEGDGATNVFPLQFTLGELKRSYVTCQVADEVDGLGNPVYRELIEVPGDPSMIQIAGAVPAVGDKIEFRRVVPKDLLLHLYANGSILDYPSIDESHLQLMMALHEVLDGVGLKNVYNDINMHGYKLTNVFSDPDDPDSIATVAFLGTYRQDALDAAVAAANSAIEALGYRDTALMHANTAAAQIVLCQDQVQLAVNQVVLAEGHADAAALSALAADGFAGDAEQSALDALAAVNSAAFNNMPIGSLVFVTGNTPANGTIAAQGQLLSRAAYPDLWSYAQASGNISVDDARWTKGQYSPGDGVTTFRVPNLQDQFIRGASGTRAVGNAEEDAIRNITGSFDIIGNSNAGSASGSVGTGPFTPKLITNGFLLHAVSTAVQPRPIGYAFDASHVVPTADENRPKNVAYLVCIKAYDVISDPNVLNAVEVVNEISRLESEKLRKDENINLGVSVAASGTAVDFVGIPEGVKRITVMFDGVSTNGASTVCVRLGTSSGIEDSGYASVHFTSSGGFSTNGFVLGGFVGAADLRIGSMDISNISGRKFIAAGIFNQGSTIGMTVTGSKTLSGTLDRIRITTVNGTDQFDAGTINISWEF